jgi:uncharacterized membrane protein YhhN
VWLQNIPRSLSWWLFMAALAMSLTGDIILMFDARGALFFIAGLISFLWAHIFYIILFVRLRPKPFPSLQKLIFPLTWIAVACLGFLQQVEQLGALHWPVLIYAATILTMVETSFSAFERHERNIRWLVCTGTLLFVISDGLLAYNKFFQPVEFAGIGVMLTYALAQLLIVIGVVKFMLSTDKA